MNSQQLLTEVQFGKYDPTLIRLYGEERLIQAKQRILELCEGFSTLFNPNADVVLISAPGRTEVGGNHTDHQRGRVLAAAVHMDVLCLASRNASSIVSIRSDGFEIQDVDLNDLGIRESEKFTSESLIRGVASRLSQLGFSIGGFDCVIHSTVLKGSGISSSAAFEVALGSIFNHLFNQAGIDAPTIAKIGQYAENVHFGKPCGLMDQMASAVGGFVAIDFFDKENPDVKKISFDFKNSGYSLCIVDTGSSHADLSDEYAGFPIEMKAVARCFGQEVLSEVQPGRFFNDIPRLRAEVGDRAVLRALHFFQETDRVLLEVDALSCGDFDAFLDLIIESGRSSYMYLQNVFVPGQTRQQSLALALSLSESYLKGRGAWRVHGGGLAGTIQAIVKNEDLPGYCAMMEDVFAKGSCHVMRLRDEGGYRII